MSVLRGPLGYPLPSAALGDQRCQPRPPRIPQIADTIPIGAPPSTSPFTITVSPVTGTPTPHLTQQAFRSGSNGNMEVVLLAALALSSTTGAGAG